MGEGLGSVGKVEVKSFSCGRDGACFDFEKSTWQWIFKFDLYAEAFAIYIFIYDFSTLVLGLYLECGSGFVVVSCCKSAIDM